MFKKLLLVALLGLMPSANSFGAATYSRVKTWSSGETLTASDLNAEFNNILTNGTTAGLDDYSATATEMRVVTDPYPAAAESLATSLQGELERIRYQILEIKKAVQASNVTYWYQDLPTAGVFTVAGSSVGVNDTTPDATMDVAGTLLVDSTATFSLAITTTDDDVDFSTHVTVAGDLTVSGILTSGTRVIASSASFSATSKNPLVYGSETVDSLSEFNGSTFTASTAGYYTICVNAWTTPNVGDSIILSSITLYKNGFFGDRPGSFGGPSSTDQTNLVNGCVDVYLAASDTIMSAGSCNDTTGSDACDWSQVQISVHHTL